MNNHTLQNTKGELTDLEAIKIATASHRSSPSSPAAAALHGKTEGPMLRLPPQHKAHATFMRPLQCVLQPRLPKHHVAAKRRNSQNTSNQHLYTLRTTPSPARTCRTHKEPFTAACSHFTRKNGRPHAPASSPIQAPCNIHAAIPMRSETRDSTTAWNYTHRKTPKVQNTKENQKTSERACPQPPHTRAAFHRRLQPLYTEKRKVSCPGFLPNTSPMQHQCGHYNAFCGITWQTRIYLYCSHKSHTTLHQAKITRCKASHQPSSGKSHQM